MKLREIPIQRFTVTSSRAFDKVVSSLESQIGRPDMTEFGKNITAALSLSEMEEVIGAAVGVAGLMEFARFDLGEFLRKETGSDRPRAVRFVAGNPLIMKQMVERVPDAGSYAPITILVDEREDGVHLSYDRMASFLAPYGNEEALKVARDLDSKVEALLLAAASPSR